VAFHVAMFDRAAAAGFALGGKSDAAPDMANAKALIDKGLQGEDNMLAEGGSALATGLSLLTVALMTLARGRAHNDEVATLFCQCPSRWQPL